MFRVLESKVESARLFVLGKICSEDSLWIFASIGAFYILEECSSDCKAFLYILDCRVLDQTILDKHTRRYLLCRAPTKAIPMKPSIPGSTSASLKASASSTVCTTETPKADLSQHDHVFD